MARPHYVAHRVGDHYVMVRTDAAGACGRPALLAGGAAAAAVAAVAVRGPARWALAAAGVGLVAAWCRCNGMPGGWGTGRRAAAAPAGGPSFPREGAVGPAGRQSPADAVDEAAMESFPASDPPAHRG